MIIPLYDSGIVLKTTTSDSECCHTHQVWNYISCHHTQTFLHIALCNMHITCSRLQNTHIHTPPTPPQWTAHLMLPSHPLFSNQVSLHTDCVSRAPSVCLCVHVWRCSQRYNPPAHQERMLRRHLGIHSHDWRLPCLLGLCCRGSVSLCKWCLPDEKEAGAAMMFTALDCVKLASGTSEGLFLYLAVFLTMSFFSILSNILEIEIPLTFNTCFIIFTQWVLKYYWN